MLAIDTIQEVARVIRESGHSPMIPERVAELRDIESRLESSLDAMVSTPAEDVRREVLDPKFDARVAMFPLLFEVFAILRDAHDRLPAPIAVELSRLMELLDDFEELAEQILDIRALENVDESEPLDHPEVHTAFG